MAVTELLSSRPVKNNKLDILRMILGVAEDSILYQVHICIYNPELYIVKDCKNTFFDVLLTVHLSIILVTDQLNAQIVE